MEKVLDVYKLPYDPQNPVVCMDESPKQLIAETRIPIPASPGNPEKHDYEYERRGTCNIFVAFEPLTGNRMVEVTERRTKEDWAHFMEKITCRYEKAEKINVTDNDAKIMKHKDGSLKPSYNGQIAVDDKEQVIVAADLVTDTNDVNKSIQ
jgi:hypothetical protein